MQPNGDNHYETVSDPIRSLVITDKLAHCVSLSLEQYRRFLVPEVWYLFREIVYKTRAYDYGLTAAIHMLNLTETYRSRIPKDEYWGNQCVSLMLVLEMLDTQDRWDEFASLFRSLRGMEHFSFRIGEKRLQKGYLSSEMKACILKKGKRLYSISSFCYLHPRYETIQRKIERRGKGWKLGNQFHPQQEDFTPEEVEARADWLKRVFRQCAEDAARTAQATKTSDGRLSRNVLLTRSEFANVQG